MTYACRIGRLMSWDWENMGVLSGEKKGPFGGKGLRYTYSPGWGHQQANPSRVSRPARH